MVKVLSTVVDSIANLDVSTKIIPDGLIIKESGKNKFKIGNGINKWEDLPYTGSIEFTGLTEEQKKEIKGEPGKDFKVTKTYSSVTSMQADFANTDVEIGDFVMIYTGSVEDADTGKLYVKDETEFKFLTDLSGIAGMNGKSAYEIAVEDGFSGTKSEWIASLHATVTIGSITIAEL